MLALPYKILAGAIPANRNGVYMGIFNMFIVIPMIIQIFALRYFLYDWLGSDPTNVITLAGVCLIAGGISALFIKEKLATTKSVVE